MLKTVLLILLAYIAYRFIFGFLIPVTRATRTVRRQFKAAQEQMEAQMRAHQQAQETRQQEFARSKEAAPADNYKTSEYIDFEEIK